MESPIWIFRMRVFMNKISLIHYLELCCRGLNASASEVIGNLLNKNNIDDILSGHIPVRTLKAHIKVWVDDGKKNFEIVPGLHP